MYFLHTIAIAIHIMLAEMHGYTIEIYVIHFTTILGVGGTLWLPITFYVIPHDYLTLMPLGRADCMQIVGRYSAVGGFSSVHNTSSFTNDYFLTQYPCSVVA